MRPSSLTASQPMRMPGMPYALDMPLREIPRSYASAAAGRRSLGSLSKPLQLVPLVSNYMWQPVGLLS